MELIERRRTGNSLGEDADDGLVLPGLAGSGVAADDIVVQDRFEIPSLCLGEFGEVAATLQALLLARDRDEDDGGGDSELGEHACGLKRHRDSAGVVIGSGRGIVRVEGVGVARVVVAGDQDAAAGLRGIGSLEHGVDVL